MLYLFLCLCRGILENSVFLRIFCHTVCCTNLNGHVFELFLIANIGEQIYACVSVWVGVSDIHILQKCVFGPIRNPEKSFFASFWLDLCNSLQIFVFMNESTRIKFKSPDRISNWFRYWDSPCTHFLCELRSVYSNCAVVVTTQKTESITFSLKFEFNLLFAPNEFRSINWNWLLLSHTLPSCMFHARLFDPIFCCYWLHIFIHIWSTCQL